MATGKDGVGSTCRVLARLGIWLASFKKNNSLSWPSSVSVLQFCHVFLWFVVSFWLHCCQKLQVQFYTTKPSLLLKVKFGYIIVVGCCDYYYLLSLSLTLSLLLFFLLLLLLLLWLLLLLLLLLWWWSVRRFGEIHWSGSRSRGCQGTLLKCFRTIQNRWNRQQSGKPISWWQWQKEIMNWSLQVVSWIPWQWLKPQNHPCCFSDRTCSAQVLGDLAVAGKLTNIMLHRVPQVKGYGNEWNMS